MTHFSTLNHCLGTIAPHLRPDLGINVHGSGVGDKVGQLLVRGPEILDVGFRLNPKEVFGSTLLEAVLQEHNLSLYESADPSVVEEVMRSSPVIRRVLTRIAEQFKDSPFLLVRSSGFGDARGTGVYESDFCPNEINFIIDSFACVASSYFAPDGESFRQRSGHSRGFAISIEPVLGSFDSDPDVKSFYPLLAGNAYSDSIHGAFLLCAIGLADEAVHDSRKAFRITPEMVEEAGDYTPGLIERLYYIHGNKHGQTYLQPRGINRRSGAGWLYTGLPFEALTVSFKDFFRKLTQLADTLGGPQYIEWVADKDVDGNFQIYVTQIAALDKRVDYFQLPELRGKLFLSCSEVQGSGECNVEDVLIYDNPVNLSEIKRFNDEHPEGYIFILEGRLLDGDWSRDRYRLPFSHHSNAKVICIDGVSGHARDIFSHFEGATSESGIILGVLDDARGLLENIEKFGFQRRVVKDGLSHIQGNFHVVANGSDAAGRFQGKMGMVVLAEI